MSNKTVVTIDQIIAIANQALKSHQEYVEGMEFKSAKIVGNTVKFDGEVFYKEGKLTDKTSKAILLYAEISEEIIKSYTVV